MPRLRRYCRFRFRGLHPRSPASLVIAITTRRGIVVRYLGGLEVLLGQPSPATPARTSGSQIESHCVFNDETVATQLWMAPSDAGGLRQKTAISRSHTSNVSSCPGGTTRLSFHVVFHARPVQWIYWLDTLAETARHVRPGPTPVVPGQVSFPAIVRRYVARQLNHTRQERSWTTTRRHRVVVRPADRLRPLDHGCPRH